MLLDGITMMHEHVTIDLSRIKNTDDTNLNCKEETIKEFKELYDFGVRNILDATNKGMCRNPEYVREVAERTGINIIQSTGFYKEPFLPDFVYDMSEEELSEWMINEIENGIESTNIKARAIGEIGTSLNKIEEVELKIFKASILAHKKTGVIISTHTSLGTMALEQAKIFLDNGANPSKVIIGHQDLCGDINQIKKLIELGFNIAFDTIGKNNYFPDEERVKMILDLQENKMLDSLVLSMDLTRKSNMKYKGGIGYTYFFTHFIEMLKKAGVTDESLRKMLVENPKNLLGVHP